MSSAVHVRFPRATGGRGSLGQWLGGKSGNCVRRARARGEDGFGDGIVRVGEIGGDEGGCSGVVEGGESELPQNTNRSNGWEIHQQLFN